MEGRYTHARTSLFVKVQNNHFHNNESASIAQLGERQTEDLKALCSIHSRGISVLFCCKNEMLPHHYSFQLFITNHLLLYHNTALVPLQI